MNILFTCIGRRVELVQAFKKSAENLMIDLEIYGCDVTDDAPALYFCDHQLTVPKISDSNYISVLQKICQDNNIDAVIPTIDTDLLILSQNKNNFWPTRVVISDFEKIKLCRDKNYTSDYFKTCGLNSPQIYNDINDQNIKFPVFIKPKDGSSSINAFKVNNFEELIVYSKIIDDYVIQQFIEGTEYTVDVFCDFDGNPIYITPRLRIQVREGEVLKTQITQDEKIISEIKDIVNDFKPCGAITIQLIRDPSGFDYYIEINPRFGGGAPLSIKAGADSAEALLKLLNHESLEYKSNAARDNVCYSRFDQSIEVNCD